MEKEDDRFQTSITKISSIFFIYFFFRRALGSIHIDVFSLYAFIFLSLCLWDIIYLVANECFKYLFFFFQLKYVYTDIFERWICISMRQWLYRVLASHWSYFDKIWRSSNFFFLLLLFVDWNSYEYTDTHT